MKGRMTLATLMVLLLAGLLAISNGPVVMAHTEADPFVTDLIADQTLDIGEVSVWNDGTHLFVRYETNGDWTIGTTHLHVATALTEIPQNKKGNPKVGKFEHSALHDPPVTDVLYVIELDEWDVGTGLFIAAHAVVCGPGRVPMFAQGLIMTVPLYAWPEAWEVGTVTAAIEGESLVITYQTMSGWLMEATHLYLDPTTPPAWPPAWGSFPHVHGALGEVSTDSFAIPLSDLGVSCGDMLFVSAHASLIKHIDEFRWIRRDGWGDENPFDGWLKYFTITLPCKLVCETAWGEGLPFPGNSWAMYFTYTVQ